MRHLRQVLSDTPIHQAKANSDKHAERICDSVTHVCLAVEGGLYVLNNAAKGTRTDEDGDQPELTSAGQREGKIGERHEVDEFIAPLGSWGQRLERPEHRGGLRRPSRPR